MAFALRQANVVDVGMRQGYLVGIEPILALRMPTTNTSPAPCQNCGMKIVGKVFRFTDQPASAFCSSDCQLSATTIVVAESHLQPPTSRLPTLPTYHGPVAETFHCDRGCGCEVRYANEITVRKRHSVIGLCPRCGCVTVD